jgi:hypothetical protein
MAGERRTAWIATTMIVLPILIIAFVRLRPAATPPVESISAIVVLPARVLGGTSLDYLSDAVARDLTRHLQRIPALETKTPPARSDIERSDMTHEDAADAYGVDALVLTALTFDAGMFQLNLQLYDPRQRQTIWKSPYHAPRAKYLELVRAAGEGLRRALRPSSDDVRMLPGLSESSEAQLAFHEGLYHETRDPQRARRAISRALELDPGFAEAAAAMTRLNERK